jgi:hypothetical protein
VDSLVVNESRTRATLDTRRHSWTPVVIDMAVRIRPAGEDAGPPANGRCTTVVERRATGERIPVPREIRDEFIAIQLAARELCCGADNRNVAGVASDEQGD